MAKITEARFDLVANDRTQGAFKSVEDGFRSMRRASQLFGMVIGTNLMGSLKRSVDEIVRLADQGINLIPIDDLQRIRDAKDNLEAIRYTFQAILAQGVASSPMSAIGDFFKHAAIGGAGVGKGALAGLMQWGENDIGSWDGVLESISQGMYEGADAAEQFFYKAQNVANELRKIQEMEEKAQSERAAQGLAAAAERERESILSREVSAGERIKEILLGRRSLEGQIEELSERAADFRRMSLEDVREEYQWLLKAVEAEERIERLREQMATRDGGAAKEDAVRGSFGSFADVNRRAQEFALKKQEARDEKRNKYLEEIAANTGEMAVFG